MPKSLARRLADSSLPAHVAVSIARNQAAAFVPGQIAAHADEWDMLLAEQVDTATAAARMNVSLPDAEYFLYLAGERFRALQTVNGGARRKLSMSETLEVYGTKGIMRVKSHIRQPRELALPQFMA